MASLLTFCMLFTIFFGKYKISQKKALAEENNYKGIVSLWHIDGFEGGTGSRKQFLMNVSRQFEKTHKGVLIMVVSHTKTSALEAVKQGNLPDMISFSNGVNVDNLVEIKGDLSARFKGGNIGQKSYAVCWCRGNYTLIANPKIAKEELGSKVITSAIVSQGENTLPLIALLKDGYQVNDYVIKEPFNAYVEFTLGKIPYLIGTQRDVIRLTNRGMEFKSYPLKNYNDLLQYVAITSTSKEKQEISLDFINLLTSKTIQKSLYKIGMMSIYEQVDSDVRELNEMQEIKGFSTISIFTLDEKIKELQGESVKAINGDKSALEKISKLII